MLATADFDAMEQHHRQPLLALIEEKSRRLTQIVDLGRRRAIGAAALSCCASSRALRVSTLRASIADAHDVNAIVLARLKRRLRLHGA